MNMNWVYAIAIVCGVIFLGLAVDKMAQYNLADLNKDKEIQLSCIQSGGSMTFLGGLKTCLHFK